MSTNKQREEKENKKKKWLLLLLLLLLFVVITVLIVLYILGAQAVESPQPTTAPTIVVPTAQPTTAPEEDLPISLSVKLQSTTGRAYSGGIIELHSDVKTAVTNSDGIAFLYDIEEGTHTIYAKSSAGSTLASVEVEITQNDAISSAVISGDHLTGYQIQVPDRTALLELQLTIFGNYLKIDTTYISTASFDKAFENYEGTFYADEYNIMTSQSNIVATSGIIIIPNIGIIESDGTFTPFGENSDGSYTFADGMKVTSNGTIYFSNGKESYRDTSYGVYFANDEVLPLTDTVHLSSSSSSDDLPNPTDPTVSWGEDLTFDIFGDTSGMVYPGISGEYEFTIENPNYYAVDCYLTITETERADGLYLPMVYVLKMQNSDGSYEYIEIDETFEDFENGVYYFNISSYASAGMVLEWEWKFEVDDKSDTYDTSIAAAADLKHEIKLSLYTESAE